MEQIELEVKKREKTGTAKSNVARRSGIVPAVIYGKGSASISVELDYKKFNKLIHAKAGKNVIITLKVADGGKDSSIPVLAHDIQINALTDKIIHVDFYRVKMDEAIKAKIHVYLTGEAIGVKLDGGILVQGLREIEVKCLPTKIPDKFTIDVSALKIGTAIHVSDIKVEKDIMILTPANDIVASVSAPAAEEVEAAPVAAPEVTGQTTPVAGAPGAAPVAGAAPAAGKEAAPAKGAAAPAKGAAAPAKGAAAPAKGAAPEAKKK
jgi:large subunit ribosomal protein L25